ncbi:MAG: IS21 family transposase [Planctomycetota bacterium]
MANQLKVAVVHAIEVLLERGWSQRRIAGALGVDRGTVARYARRAREPANPAKAPPGSDGAPTGSERASAGVGAAFPGSCTDSKAATEAPPGSTSAEITSLEESGGVTATAGVAEASSSPRPANQTSKCESFRKAIQAKLDKGLTARRIHQDLVSEYGFGAKYHSVRRFVRRLGQNRPLPFRRMECGPGEEAQVDFGTGAPILQPNGRRRRPHVFRIVLSHSRKGYSEAVFKQSTESFIGALENAFRHFGGVPKTLVVDNLKAAVIKADWFDPDLNPKIQSFGDHYHTVVLPTKPRTPRHKGKIEAGVKYVQSNGLKGRSFSSLEEQNRFLFEWETSVADTRIHGTTRKQVGKVFREVERETLLPLPVDRFPFFHEAQRSVHRDGHVEVDKAYYSVPPEHLGRKVWVRWDSHTVRIFDQRMQQVARHAKRDPGRFATEPAHIASEKINSVERGAAWLLNKVSLIGSHAQHWAEAMLAERGIQGVRVLQGLRSLAGRHPCESIEKACQIAHTHGAYRLRFIRALIKREAPKQEQFEFIQEHPIIRSLSDYDELVHASFQE